MATSTVEPRITLPQLPTHELGLPNMPAFPIDTAGMLNKQDAGMTAGLR
jgi:hypothetical protein